jgi:hypothetical protein
VVYAERIVNAKILRWESGLLRHQEECQSDWNRESEKRMADEVKR